MKDVSIIIINHNTKKLCKQTVDSIRRTTHSTDYEIIVVDNSPDQHRKSMHNYDDILLISGVENKGFGHACNVGADEAQGRYLLFLNSDTLLHESAVDRAIIHMDNHFNVGALGIKTILESGSLDHGCKRGFPSPMRAFYYFTRLDKLFPHNRTIGGYRMTYLNEDETNEVDSVSGSFLLIPRRLFYEIGKFDEAFFMYGEDLDLCYRVKKHGYAVVYYAGASMLHLKGQSGLCTKNLPTLYHFYNAMTLFYDKHFRQEYSSATTWLVHSAIKWKYRSAMRGINE